VVTHYPAGQGRALRGHGLGSRDTTRCVDDASAEFLSEAEDPRLVTTGALASEPLSSVHDGGEGGTPMSSVAPEIATGCSPTWRLFALHHTDPTNTGDIGSAPSLWIPELHDADHIGLIDGNFSRITQAARHNEVVVIIGGGGLFGNEWFYFQLEQFSNVLRQTPNIRVVVWGAGFNTHYDRRQYPSPSVLEMAAVVGIRDFGTQYPHVPCASVLHPAFANAVEPVHEVVVYTHKRDTALAAAAVELGLPVYSNYGPDVGAAISFIQSGATVITGTYHGAYWGLVAGREVAICGAFSTKFNKAPWDVPISQGVGIKAAVRSARALPNMYAECLLANQNMKTAVLNIVGRQGHHPSHDINTST